MSGRYEDEDGIDGPFDQAMDRAMEEDRMARELERERREERNAELDAMGFPASWSHSCPAGEMYVHKPGVFCPACGSIP